MIETREHFNRRFNLTLGIICMVTGLLWSIIYPELAEPLYFTGGGMLIAEMLRKI